MAERSITQLAMNTVSRSLAEGLACYGFTRKQRHLFRRGGSLVHAVHLQASQWGNNDSGSFTINLAVSEPTVFRIWTGRPFPTNPATALFPICSRIGPFLPENRDVWWDVDRSTDLDQLSETVTSSVCPVALQFFERFPDSTGLLDSLLHDEELPGVTSPQRPILRAMLAVADGNLAEAEKLLDDASRAAGNSPFAETVARIRARILRMDQS